MTEKTLAVSKHQNILLPLREMLLFSFGVNVSQLERFKINPKFTEFIFSKIDSALKNNLQAISFSLEEIEEIHSTMKLFEESIKRSPSSGDFETIVGYPISVLDDIRDIFPFHR